MSDWTSAGVVAIIVAISAAIVNIIVAWRTKIAVAEVHTVVNSKNDLLVKEIKESNTKISDLQLLVADLRRDKENLAAKNE